MPRSASRSCITTASSSPVDFAVGREAPVLDQLGAVEGADVGLRVADVDREQHGGDYSGRSELADALDPLARRKRCERGASGVPSGSARPGSSSSSGTSTKRRLVTSRMRQAQPLGVEHHVAEQQQVDVDRARPVARARRLAAQLALDRLADVEQRRAARAPSRSAPRR